MYIIFIYYKLGFSFKVMCLCVCVCILTHSSYNLQLYFSINIGETVA